MTKGESVTPPSRKKGEREGAIGSRFAPSSWPGTTKEALSRGCSFGQCLLFLPRSLPSLLSFSLAPSLLPSPPVLFLSLPLASRSLSLLPPTRQRSRAASRTRDTDACEIPLSSCERTPVRGQDYPAPCAIAKNQFVAPATHRHRCRRRRRRVVVVVVLDDGESRDVNPTPRITGLTLFGRRMKENAVRSEMCTRIAV